jgi:DNA-binding LacI/PurR family transcriptional regulator
VSYVLNDAPGRPISESTRQLVLRTAHELGHVPHASARSLRLGRSNIVLALVRDFTLGFISNTVMHRLDIALAERGYLVLTHRFDESVRSVRELFGLVSPTMVVAMGGLSVPDESEFRIGGTKFLRVHGIVSHERVGELQAEHLASQGHRLIGYALPSSPSLALIAEERLLGLRRACERLGLPQPVVTTVDTSAPETVFAALRAYEELDEPVTALATHNDEIAILFCSALNALGQRAGRDLAVIGVDNIPAARIDLTTVEIDAEAWGKAVVDVVVAMLEDREPEPIGTDFLRLVVRETA